MVRRAALALALSLGAVPALADEEQPSIALLDVRAGPGVPAVQAPKIRKTLTRSLSQFRVKVVDDHPALLAAHGAGADAATGAKLAEARSRAKEGKKLFDDLDPAGAEVKFRQAADLFEANAGGLTSPADLIGTYLFLARVFFATEREVLARDIFKRVVQLQPDLTLDRAIYPPGMISVFDDVKKALLASPLGTMSVSSLPTPAQVSLDGRDRGRTPLELVNIPAGVHVLTVRRIGYAPFVRPVDVTSFRVEKIAAELALDRHPGLDQLFLPAGGETKDVHGGTVSDYVEAVATAASLDVVFVGRVVKAGVDRDLEVRAYNHKTKTWGSIQRFPLPNPKAADTVASAILARASSDGWIPSISARRNVAAGGGALDETARLLVRTAIVPGTRVAGSAKNFPENPGAGFRIGADYRLGARVLLTAETGFDSIVQSNVVLTDTAGNVVASGGANIQSLYLSVPFDLGARYYFGVSTFAPYASLGGGIRYDRLSFQETLPFDHIRGSSGIGFNGFIGGGVDYAMGARSGLFFEARLHTGTIGVGDASLRTDANPPAPARKLPVDPGLFTGVRLYFGYLKVF